MQLSHDNNQGRSERVGVYARNWSGFSPELIELMKSVLDDATAMLPEAKRTSSMKAEIASHILECAAKGERNPIALKTAALSAVVECSHYSHDISPARSAV